MSVFLILHPRDPVVARDGRPFGAASGQRVHSLDWLTPSVAAGSLRTLLGKQSGGFDDDQIKRLLEVATAGPLPWAAGELYFRAPQDVFWDGDRRLHVLRPADENEGEGTDAPLGLRPVCAPGKEQANFKAHDPPTWWAQSRLIGWLTMSGQASPDFLNSSTGFLVAPARDERWHLRVDPDRYAAEEGMLFATTGLELEQLRAPCGRKVPISLALRVDPAAFGPTLQDLDQYHPLGGKRRLVQFTQPQDGAALATA